MILEKPDSTIAHSSTFWPISLECHPLVVPGFQTDPSAIPCQGPFSMARPGLAPPGRPIPQGSKQCSHRLTFLGSITDPPICTRGPSAPDMFLFCFDTTHFLSFLYWRRCLNQGRLDLACNIFPLAIPKGVVRVGMLHSEGGPQSTATSVSTVSHRLITAMPPPPQLPHL